MVLAEVNLGTQKRNIRNKIFNIINTYAFCGDMGSIIVECESINELGNYGFDDADLSRIDGLEIGGLYESYDYGNGCVVVRMG